MEDLSMRMTLGELYQLVGDNKGISFLYEALPGVTVTIGFTVTEENEFNEMDDDDNDTTNLH